MYLTLRQNREQFKKKKKEKHKTNLIFLLLWEGSQNLVLSLQLSDHMLS